MNAQTKTVIENEMAETVTGQAEAAAQVVAFDELSNEELEARISKESGGSGGYAYC